MSMSNAKFQADILNEIEDLGPSKIDSTIQTLPKRFREKSESLAGRVNVMHLIERGRIVWMETSF